MKKEIMLLDARSLLCRSARGCDHFRNTHVRTRTSNQLCDSLCTVSDEHR